MHLSKFLLLFALILSNFLTGCEAGDDTRAVTFVVYNYTERPIFSSSVNGVGAGNAFAGYKNGGGGWVCCGDITIGKPAVIKWTYSRTKKQFEAGVQIEHHETTVTIPPPQTPEASYLDASFLPGSPCGVGLGEVPGTWKVACRNQDGGTRVTNANQAIQRSATQSNSGNSELSEGCYICQRILWISVFFDEPGHDAISEYGTDKLSNIGKLYHAHTPTDVDRGIYRLNYNGLGVKFKEPNVTRGKTGVDIAKDTGQDTLEGKAKDAGKGVLKDGIKKGAQDALKDLKNPKSWSWDLVGIVAKVGMESMDSVRDKPAVSQISLSRVATRVDNAVAKIDEVVKSQSLPVKHINLAVFGSGLGGAMARLFINKLLEVCAPKALPGFPIASGAPTIYPTAKGDTTLEIKFLGLLDCISATLSDNWLVGLLGDKLSLGFATTRIKGPMGVPEEVLQTVHYVAGHELRVTRRLDSVRKGKGQTMTETTLPGNHDDIVGNYQEGFQNRSNQLARFAAKKLHGDAYGAGVPFMSMPKLEKKDIDLYNLMQATAKSPTHRGQSNETNMSMGVMVREYPATSGKLEAQFLEHMRLLMSWMSLRYHSPDAHGRPGEAAYNMIEKRRNQIQSWKSHPNGKFYLNQITKEELSLRDVWLHPISLHDYVQTLFDDYIHDESYQNAWNLAAADAGHHSYFALRAIDESNEVNGVAKVKAEQEAKWKAESDEYARMTRTR